MPDWLQTERPSSQPLRPCRISRVTYQPIPVANSKLQLKSLFFSAVTGDIISFDGNGDRLVRYIVAASRNWIEETHSATVSAEPMVIVGSFQTDAHLTVNNNFLILNYFFNKPIQLDFPAISKDSAARRNKNAIC